MTKEFPYRPTFHFTPKKNWMNDPNAPIFWDGVYHLFFQHNPFGRDWGHMHWGHCTSRDLVNWQELDLALYPSKNMGEEHCFSGCCFKRASDGTFYIYYTCIGRNDGSVNKGAEQWLVTSKDLVTFEKYAQNPVMGIGIHNGLEVRDWRDPFVWEEEDGFHMVLAAATGSDGNILHYRSDNLYDWVYDRIIFTKMNNTLECPAIIKKDDEYLLIYSTTANFEVEYVICGKDFSTGASGRIDASSYCYYAATVSKAADGRNLLWGWLMDDKERADKEWVGAQSFPREISFDKSGVYMKPAVDFANDYPSLLRISNNNEPNIRTELKSPNLALYIKAAATEGEITICLDYSDCERLLVNISLSEECLKICHTDEKRMDFKTADDEQSVIMLVDGCLVEVFVNERYCISSYIYPKLLGDMALTISADKAQLRELRAVELTDVITAAI